MIQHVVVAKFKPEISHSEIESILADLRALPQQIEEIVTYECGLDEWHGERSYDFGLVAAFRDMGAQSRYQEHPAHVAIARRLRAASQHLVTVDLRI